MAPMHRTRAASDGGTVATITVSTIAGDGSFGHVNGEGASARFSSPYGVAVDALGNMLVADTDNHCIRKITPANVVSTIAGDGSSGHVDGEGASARFNSPGGVAIDAAGNVLVADTDNHRICKITAVGVVSTIAGDGSSGHIDCEGASASARFASPYDVAVDAAGNVLVADANNHCIRKITPAGVVSTIAGDGNSGHVDGEGASARFSSPRGVAVDALGNVLVADTDNHRIRKITPAGVVSTIAGDGSSGHVDGEGASARFNIPGGVAIDAAGNVLVADTDNHRIRRITAAGVVSTIAGAHHDHRRHHDRRRPSRCVGHIDGEGASARFFMPYGVAVDAAGNVLVADADSHRIRKIADPPHEAKDQDRIWDAAHQGNAKELRSLLSRDGEQPEGSSWPVPSALGHHLSIACARGHVECASLLLMFGAPADWAIAPREATPLMIAAQLGNLRMVKLLVEHGADFELRKSPPFMGPGDDWTPWKLAYYSKKDECGQDHASVLPNLNLDDQLLETHPWACDLPSFVKARCETADYLHTLMTARADQAMKELLSEECGPSRAKKEGKKKKSATGAPPAPEVPPAVDQAAATEPQAAATMSKNAMRRARKKAAARAAATPVDVVDVAPTAAEEAAAAEEVAAAEEAQAATAVVEVTMTTLMSPPEPPDDFVCPITHALMEDPVLATDGHTYERLAIEVWLARRLTSPRTGEALQAPTVFPNHSMRRMIIEWHEAHGV